MPIHCDTDFHRIPERVYHEIDYRVVGYAQKAQSTMGRLCEETIYQNEIAFRCREAGHAALTEVPIHVSHKTFLKPYYIDLLVDQSVIFELKTVGALTSAHEAQTLNYVVSVAERPGRPFPHRN